MFPWTQLSVHIVLTDIFDKHVAETWHQLKLDQRICESALEMMCDTCGTYSANEDDPH